MNDETTKTLKQEANAAQSVQTPNKSTAIGRAGAATIGAVVGSSADYVVGQIYDKVTEAALANAAEGENAAHAEEASGATPTAAAKNHADSAEVEYTFSDTIDIAYVDDSMSFSEAFADAREQVGPGGVFEWHGKVYGTYYKEEWNNMSPEERSEWQSHIDYNEVLSSNTYEDEDFEAEEELGTATVVDTEESEADNEVHVVGIAVQDNGQGGIATIANIEIDGNAGILVDVETDGTIDLLGFDENTDGEIGHDEVYDMSDSGIATSDIVEAYVEEAHANGEDVVITDLDSGKRYVVPEDESTCGLTPSDDNSVDNMSDPLFEA